MITKPIHTRLMYLALFIGAVFLPWYVPDDYIFQIVIMSILYAIATSAMNLIIGFTGQASLAHGAFFGIGAYTVAILMKAGFSFWFGLPVAMLGCFAIGLALGFPALGGVPARNQHPPYADVIEEIRSEDFHVQP